MAKEEIARKDYPKQNAMSNSEIQQALIDNFISLQKVMTNLSIKFDELSSNITKLLQLFEISAKTFAERYSTQELAPSSQVDAELVKKLNDLLDQNKVISRGIMLMEEKLREKNDYPEQMQQQQYPMMQQQPYPMMQQPMILPSMQQPMQQQFQQVPYKREIGARQDSRPPQK